MIKNFLDDIYIAENMSSKKFKMLGYDFKLLTPNELIDNKLLIKEIKKNKISHLFCSIGIIKTNHLKNRPDKILGISNDKLKTNIFFRKQNKYKKKYNNLKDLIYDPNITLYINKSEDYVEITCYNKNNMNILFFGKISNIEEYDELRPYDCSFVESIGAIKDINAKNIVYPLLGYYSNNNLMICDRNIITHKAKSVWLQFFDDNNYISKYLPVDNLKLTTDLDYTPISYYKCKKIKNINKLSLTKRKRKLLILKKEHYLDWVFKLNSEFKNNNENLIKTLIDRHSKSKN